MSPESHLEARSVEDSHWWFVTRRELVIRALQRWLPRGSTMLDAGCGSGGMLARLQGWRACGVDLSPTALQLCHRRGISNVALADVQALPFPDQSFDAVLCLDVLYHEQVEPVRALAECSRVLLDGGLLVLNLAAHSRLFGAHDRQVCGARRHNKREVRDLLKSLNYEMLIMHHWNCSLLPTLALWRRFGGTRGGDLRLPAVFFNAMLCRLMRWEARAAAWIQPPVGCSLFVVARHRRARS